MCKFDNLYLVSNPSFVEIEGSENKKGISVLMYHGASMHGVINEIEELRLCNAHSTPAKVVKHLLFRRHLAPSHGATTYIPNKDEDSMIIKEVPDIITTGDLHKTDIDNYNGVLIISNSCWQSMTAFEEKVGNQPDPCKVPILNLQTRAIKILDFSGDGDEILVGGRNERNKNDNLEKVDEKEGVGSGADENNNDIEGVNGVGCVKVEKECTVTSVGVGEESHEEMVCEIKNENSLKIGIDIDEVIVEYLDKFLEFYNPKFDKSFSKKDFKTYYFEDTIGGSHDNAVELVKEMGCDCDFKLVDGSKEGVKHILDNHNVFAITSRHSIFKNSTFNFLKGHFGDRFEDILFTGEAFQESGITKADLCAELGINVIIEDNIIFAKECIEKGVKVILLDKPWNQDNFEHGNFFRVNNWEGVLERIKEIRGVKNG